ncbi:hypothetical protein AAHA92_04584 [Salvia divinorum]|uniref:DUF7722 domain-containing protein n=1 Tax=Salvia divinorum TaxID=28513 RepID=A0ABD1I0V6_SALDI
MMGGGIESLPPRSVGGGGRRPNGQVVSDRGGFQMPLHYPRYSRAEYEAMPEWKVERLLNEYGLHVIGDVDHKRKFAMGAFLWGY